MNSIKVVGEVSRFAPLPRRVATTGKGWHNSLAIPVVPACAAFLWGALSLTTFGQPAAALVRGVTRDSSSGKPVPEVQVTAHGLNMHPDRATVSNTDGVFTFTNLEPGSYEFEAIKEGFRKSSARAQVDDLLFISLDLPLELAIDLSRAKKLDGPPLSEREKEMLERIDRLERRLAAMEAALISTDARGPQLQSGQLAPGPPRPGGGKTPEARPLVASLSPAAMLRTALSPEKSQTLETAQTSTHPQSARKSGPDGAPPPTVARPQPRFPDALQAPRTRSLPRQLYAVRVRRLQLAQRNRTHQRRRA